MSKSPNPYILPVVGGLALVLSGVTFWASSAYYEGRFAGMEKRVALSEAQVAEESGRASAADALAAQEAERAAALEETLAAMEAEAALRPTAVSLTQPAAGTGGGFGLGRAAYPEEIAAWDVDILPDGRGLPPGRGTVEDGEEVFANACASCHGDFAEGVDNWPVLAGGFDTLADEDPVKTVGSYWPYLSTVWDYVHRSMPFGEAQTLTDDEVYAITAYILYSNDLVDDEFELSHENFAEFEMYNADGFVVDDRPATEYAAWRGEPCMENCKPGAEITRRATTLNVTPVDEATMAVIEARLAAARNAPAAAVVEEKEAAAPKPATTVIAMATPEAAQAEEASDPALAEAGAKVFRKCKSCHQVGEKARNGSGPMLNGIVGHAAGAVDGFKYSKALVKASGEGLVWTPEELDAFLAKPKSYLKGTKMSFGGLKKEKDRTALIEYLKTFE